MPRSIRDPEEQYRMIKRIIFGMERRNRNRQPYSPKSLKDLVSSAKNSFGNNILQQLVLDCAEPNKCNENYMISVLFSISDSAVNTPNEDGYVPFHVAVKQLNCPLVERFITRLGNRIDINCRHSKTGKTALHFAAEISGGHDMIALLISKGADVNARDRNDETPLFDAAAEGSLKNMKVLVENGADVNARNKYDVSPLFTVDEDQYDLAIFLINQGAIVQEYQRQPYHNKLIDMLIN